MQKNKVSFLAAGCLFFTLSAHAAKVQIGDETIDCDVKSFSHLICEGKGASKGKRTLVIMRDDASVAFEQAENGMVKIKNVQKISEGKKTLFQSDSKTEEVADNKANRARVANLFVTLEDPSIPELTDFISKARDYLKSDGIIRNPLKVKYNNKNFECEVGYRQEVVQTGHKRRFDEKLKCPLYSCTGKDGESAILHVPVASNEDGNTNLVIMKNGNAQYIDSGFTVEDDSGALVESELESRSLPLEDRLAIDSDFLIPTGYKGDKKTFLYMTNVNKDDYLVHAQNLCSSQSNLKKLLDEQKKIGNSLTEISEQQKLVELVTLVDQTLRVTLVDREKGLKAGCLYWDKVYADRTDDKMADVINELSGPNVIDKFLTEDEVQKLYKDVSYIPGGNAGLRSGAEARAHMLSKALSKKGIQHNKIWIKGNLQRYWNYNVAVFVKVKKKNGEVVNYVLDPTNENEAVNEIDWVKKQIGKDKDRVTTTSYPIAENASVFHRNVIAYSSPDMYSFDYENLTEDEKTERAYSDFKDEFNKQNAKQFE